MKDFPFERSLSKSWKMKHNSGASRFRYRKPMMQGVLDRHETHSENRAAGFNTIQNQLRPLVTLLKIFGAYSIDDSGIIYKAGNRKWSSPSTWYSYGLKSIMLFSLITSMCNLGLDVAFPIRALSLGKSFDNFGLKFSTINNVSLILNSVVKIVEIILLSWNVPHFANWLNNWSGIEREYLKCFCTLNSNSISTTPAAASTITITTVGRQPEETKFGFNISKFKRKVFIFYLALPSISWVLITIFAFTKRFNLEIPYLGHSVLFLLAMILWVYSLLEDSKVLFMFKTMELAFDQILCQLKAVSANEINPSKWNLLSVSQADVLEWRQLIKLVRKQCVLASKYITSQQVLLIVETIACGAMGVGFTVSLIEHRLKVDPITFRAFLVISTWFYLNNFGRLYIKVLLAEKVRAKEREIAEEIEEIEAISCCDTATKFQLKFLYNFIIQSPVTINLGNYAALDKKLLLQVIIQVVTYLIVIIQLSGS